MFQKFWEKRPAFFIGLHFVVAASFAFFPDYVLLIPLFLLWTPFYRQPVKILQGCVLFALALSYVHLRYPLQTIPEGEIEGTAYFSISTVKPYQSPFHKNSIVYQGLIKAFDAGEKGKFFDLNCSIYVDTLFPKANHAYLIQGKLIEKGTRRYVLKPDKTVPWEKVPYTFSFAHCRYQMKEYLRLFLKKHTQDPKTLSFLSALATGDITERSLNFEFKQTGLLHILAISGFQFAIMAAFFGFFLRQFLSYKMAVLVLLGILSFYYFFLGPSPSVQRSYIAVLLFFLGKFKNYSSSGLNLLGVALILEIIFDPLLVTNLGFELTFLCTAAILLFYQPANRLFVLLLPKRKLKDVTSMSPFDQHGYLFGSWIRESLSMNFAVHFVSLPALLFLFHKMPWLSLVYNLFFPFWTTIMLFLLIISLILFPFIPPLGEFLHHLNVSFTSAALELTSNPPIAFNYFLRAKTFPLTLLMLFLTAYLAFGIYLQKEDVD